MKAYRFDQFGLENLKQCEIDLPEPGPGEVLLKVKAVSLNYRDLLMVAGKYNPRLPLPMIPLSDAACEVVELGHQVNDFRVGDRVMPIFAQNWLDDEVPTDVFQHTLGGPVHGTLREFMVVPAQAIVSTPAYLDDEQAATLPCAALTAYNALVTFGRVKKNQNILVQGTGGVSLFALQLGHALGANIIATSSSDDKLQQCKRLGASFTVNYRDVTDWHKTAREITGGRGVDLVVEVGGAGTLEKSIKSLKNGGTISLIGILAGSSKDFNFLPVLMRNICMQGILVGSKKSFLSMNDMFTQNKIQPVVDRVFSFSETRQAFDYLASGKHLGKVCIRLD